MEEYSKTFQSQQDLALLKQALTGGQISMIEYFVEVSVIYQKVIKLSAIGKSITKEQWHGFTKASYK